ncbi:MULTISPECIES: hypothetical protein [Chryseobacterium]|uniref:Uncharacterized protein n=1 Tax=Chryseobacterium gambrini TaxID=373672 RepID=A0ABN7CDU5_9FLAO|nr:MULTISPECIES: hypothetical protein [Chryseobacterium]MCQ4140814.1 hypothetical protein [Chryseobacterium sp. EO14]BEV04562.1 hypothetical protein CRDW_19360 [Chryseobacterium gambrini]
MKNNLLNLSKNQSIPFAISKIFHNFAVRKVGLSKVRMGNLLNNNASKLINYSNLKNKQWLKKSLKW